MPTYIAYCRFRNNWPVNLYGKWADPFYMAPVYPAFACGSGSVLQWDLVEWLIQNSQTHSLYPYQVCIIISNHNTLSDEH